MLVSKLAATTDELQKLAGTAQGEKFVATKIRCVELHDDITESNQQLRVHRSAHGC